MWAGSLLRSVGITAKELQCGSSAGGTLTWLKWWSRVCCWFSTPNSGRKAEREKKMKGSMQSLKWIVNVLCRYQASSFCSLSLVYQSEVTITV